MRRLLVREIQSHGLSERQALHMLRMSPSSLRYVQVPFRSPRMPRSHRTKRKRPTISSTLVNAAGDSFF